MTRGFLRALPLIKTQIRSVGLREPNPGSEGDEKTGFSGQRDTDSPSRHREGPWPAYTGRGVLSASRTGIRQPPRGGGKPDPCPGGTGQSPTSPQGRELFAGQRPANN